MDRNGWAQVLIVLFGILLLCVLAITYYEVPVLAPVFSGLSEGLLVTVASYAIVMLPFAFYVSAVRFLKTTEKETNLLVRITTWVLIFISFWYMVGVGVLISMGASLIKGGPNTVLGLEPGLFLIVHLVFVAAVSAVSWFGGTKPSTQPI